MSMWKGKGEIPSPLLEKTSMFRRLGSMGYNVNRLTPLVKQIIEGSLNNSDVKKFKFGAKDVVNRAIYEVKNNKKKKKRIDEEYKIDVSRYPPTKRQLQLRELREELNQMNDYNEKEIRKIKRMQQRIRNRWEFLSQSLYTKFYTIILLNIFLFINIVIQFI